MSLQELGRRIHAGEITLEDVRAAIAKPLARIIAVEAEPTHFKWKRRGRHREFCKGRATE